MSAPETTQATDAATPTPFAMIAGDPSAMVCEGDVCYIPGASAE
ncbi:hypothetical protein [Agromyces subbeticus]|nr:hypothetical protein [Agromyces subbeticus]